MSKEIVPEWLRLKREVLSQLAGIWHEIGKLTDWLWQLERRQDRIEKCLSELDKDPPK